MADLNALVESLSELTVLEAAELSKMLEESGAFRPPRLLPLLRLLAVALPLRPLKRRPSST